MPEEQPTARLNPETIAFPSDRITLGQIRKRYPFLFDHETGHQYSFDYIEPVGTQGAELALAERAFAASLGLPDPHPDDTRQELLHMLNADYVRWGISSGLQQTRLFVSELEASAVGQAKAIKARQR